MKIVDDESPPGAWKDEMKAAPWGYGQSQLKKVQEALNNIRKAGLWEEAKILHIEIRVLQMEVEDLRSFKKQD
jgi:hypothetical protein